MNNKKIFIIIFLLAFLIRLIALFSFAEEKSLLYVNDSLTYIQVAKNIINYGVYSMEISETPHPDNFRTPLYPMFLLPFVWLKTSLYLPVIIQSIIMSFGIALMFWLGQKIFNRRLVIIATILFALEPLGALFSAQIMTEAIFTPLFVLAILLLALYIKTSNWRALSWSAVLLALSALARPIAFYLFLLFPLAILLTKQKTKTAVQHLAVAFGIFFILVSPWLWFTIVKLHTFGFSSIINMQVYEYHGRYFDEWRAEHGAAANDRLPDIDLSPINNTLDARAIPPVKAAGMDYLKAHFPEYLLFYFNRMPYLFIDSGYSTIINGLALINSRALAVTLFLASSFFAVISLLALANPFFYYKINHQWPKEKIFLIVVIMLYTAIATPISAARFRIPLNFFLFLLALDTIFIIHQVKIIKAKNNL